MQKYLFISMLAMAIGGHFLATAETAHAARQKPQKTAFTKLATRKPVQRPPAKKPKVQNAPLHDEHSSFFSSSSDSDHCKKNCCQYVISSKEINKGKGVIIDKPGVWCLDGNACFTPKPSQYLPPDPRAVQAAITVKAGVSNVIIDLCSYRLSQAGSGTSTQTPYVVGILVPDPDPTNPNPEFVGAQSIYIKGDDAIIDGFSMYGVRIFAHTSDIELSNLTIKNSGHLASKALRPTVYGQPYLPHDQSTPAFGPSFGVAGLAIGESIGYGMGPTFFSDAAINQLNVVNRTKNVRLSNVSCLNNFLFGASITLTTNVTIDNCHFDYTWSDDPGSSVNPVYAAIAPRGLNFTDGPPNGNSDPNNVNVTMSHSTCNNTALHGDYTTQLVGLSQTAFPGNTAFIAFGCADTRSQNVLFSNCQFNSSSCTFANAVSSSFTNYSLVTSVVGGYVGGGLEDLTFTDCTFDGHFNLAGINAVHVSGATINELIKSAKNIRFLRCSANNLQCRTDLILPAPPLNTRTVQGWNISYAKDVQFEDCVSEDIYVSGPTASTGGTNAGFAPASISNNPATQVENWTFKNCTAARIRAVNGGVAWGFNTFVPSPNNAKSFIYDGCISTGNQTMLSSVYTAWSNTTSYSVGALVSFAGVNYVSLVNSNLNNPPNTSLAQWSAVNSNPAAWVSTTSYSIGSLVSFTDATGHTNEYISTINSNLGNYPNAPGPGYTATTPNWIQTNWYPTWTATATYQVNSIVALNGINYRSLVANNTNLPPNTNPGSWSTTTNVVQATAGGFFSQENLNGPELYKNCVASQNIGAPGPVVQSGLARYSTGFGTLLAFSTVYDSCIADENIYGFMLQNSTKCIVKNCKAYGNGLAGVGEGFTDLGATGTAASPTQSTSLFEGNSAFNNGNGTSHVGPNGNYNIWINAANSIRPLLLECVNSTTACVTDPTNAGTTYFAEKHNLSTVP